MVADVLHLVVSVSGALMLFCIGTLWVCLRPPSHAARRFLLAVAAFYLLASYYPVPLAVRRVLMFPVQDGLSPDLPARSTAVVLLGGGGGGLVVGRDGQLNIEGRVSAARALEAFRAYRITNAAWVITSGGVEDPASGAEPTGSRMKRTLVALGVPESRILVEADSRSTYQQAVLLAPILRDLGVTKVVLVTSDIHMLRSLGTFRRQGVYPLSASAPDPPSLEPGTHWFLPTERGLDLTDAIVHEVFGLAGYAARGWLRF